jgi:hypothetical protein
MPKEYLHEPVRSMFFRFPGRGISKSPALSRAVVDYG